VRTIKDPFSKTFSLILEFVLPKSLEEDIKKTKPLINKDLDLEERFSIAKQIIKSEAREIPSDKEEAVLLAISIVDERKAAIVNNVIQKTQELLDIETKEFSFQEVGPSLVQTFFQQSIKLVLIASVLVIIVIFIFFREIIPSLAIILAAAFDILAALAGMALFRIPLSLASIPALLMLIGYSVDTDVMLTYKLLRTKGEPKQRAHEALKTGLTMTGTTLAALAVMFSLSYYFQLTIIFQISAVLFFGLIGDLFSTWFMNAPILLIYLEKKKQRLERWRTR